MRIRALASMVALAVAPGCHTRHELEQLESSLKAHVKLQEQAVAAMSVHRAAALRAELLALDGGLGPGNGGLLGEPALVVNVPEKSLFETQSDARLRARIELLQSESERLDRVMNELSEMDARKQRSDAQLKMLEAMQADGGVP